MSAHSSIDSLRRLSPVSDVDAAAVFGAAGREELLAGVTRLPFGRGMRAEQTPRRRRPVLALAALALVGIATAATWAALSSGPARETTSVECVIKGVDTIIPSSSGNPVTDCAAQWQRDEGTAAPPLRAYDNSFGGVTVLPRSETPPSGWKPLQSQDVALIELQDSLDDAIAGLNSSCLDGTAATSLTQRKLAEFGFIGWTATLRSASTSLSPNATNAAPTVRSSSACYDAEYIDPSSSTVQLIPIGAPTTTDSTVKNLADELRPLTQSCKSLPSAVAAVRAAASELGLSESARTYQLDAATDNSLRCASIYETVGGTIFLTVRGPSG
jgi:hypothetical protein